MRAWDLAGTTKKTSDWSVGVRMHRLPNNRLVISDVVRLKGTPEAVERAILATAQRDGWTTKIAIARDPGQAGLAQEAYLTRQLMGYTVVSTPESGDKVLRASPLASQANVGNLSVLDNGGGWVRTLLNELRDFPAGRFDDQVDACSRAFATLGGSGANLALWERLAEGGPLVAPPPIHTSVPSDEPRQASHSPQLNRFGTM